MKIDEMPIFERPYERLEKYGSEVLTDAELLAIILKTGSSEKSVVELARELLSKNSYKEQGLRFLNNISIKELTSFKGIGKVKAISLKAVGEIIKRVERPIVKENKIYSTSDAAKFLMPELRYERVEKFCVIYMDSKNNIDKIKYYTNFRENEVHVSVKSIFKDAVKEDSCRLLIAHNHPSGDPTPSVTDIEFTKELKRLAYIFEIELLDHIVIGDGIYISIMKYI